VTETKLERKTLREWREEAGLTLAELGELAGCAKSTVRDIEQGSTKPGSRAARAIAAALGITIDQIVEGMPEREIDTAWWGNDGFSPTAPTKPLRWWRERRALTTRELSRLSGVNARTIENIEIGAHNGVRLPTRRLLANALKVYPDKLLLPGDQRSTEERSVESILRAELRGARRALGKAHDFMLDDSNITFKAQDARDALLPDIQRELKGV
jgi:transcriptional regulator with XRE-family HTH domain